MEAAVVVVVVVFLLEHVCRREQRHGDGDVVGRMEQFESLLGHGCVVVVVAGFWDESGGTVKKKTKVVMISRGGEKLRVE